MKLLTVEEAAEMLRVSADYVRERTRNRCPEKERIPHIKLSRKQLLFTEEGIRQFVQQHEVWSPKQ